MLLLRFRRWAATSDQPLAAVVRQVARSARSISLPLPKLVTLPYRWAYLSGRSIVFFVRRVFIAEPIFRSYCRTVGRRFRTDIFVHWVQGRGVIELGDDVLLDGKIAFAFAASFSDTPTLRIGNRTGVGHACSFVIGKLIEIGDDCRIAGGASFRDSPGHPVDAEARRRGDRPSPDAVKPIIVEHNVWIGAGASIAPGVRIGEGSVISAGANVLSDVPPYTLVAGNPARRIGTTRGQAQQISENGA